MLSFLYFTDPHARANNPESRLDNYPETVIRKVKWVLDEAKARNAKPICGGDLFNRPDVSYSIIGKLMNLFSVYGEPVYTVLGNHDIYGYNAATFERTALYLFERAGLIKRLSVDKPIYFSDMTWQGNNSELYQVQLTGYDSDYKIDKGGNVDGYIEMPVNPNTVNLHVVHGFLTDHEWPQVAHTDYHNILHTCADILCSGHEHSGYGVKVEYVNGRKKIFVNPGALLRVSASVGDVNQDVKVALINVYSLAEYSVELIPLPENIALPAYKVLDREKLVEEKRNREKVERFMESIENFSLSSDTFDIYKMLDEVEQSGEVSPVVIKIIRRKFQIAEEKMAKERRDE